MVGSDTEEIFETKHSRMVKNANKQTIVTQL